MPKFFIKTENLKENEEIWITGSDVNHIKNVLRKKSMIRLIFAIQILRKIMNA